MSSDKESWNKHHRNKESSKTPSHEGKSSSMDQEKSNPVFVKGTNQQEVNQKATLPELRKVSQYVSWAYDIAFDGCSVTALKECAAHVLSGMPQAYIDICVHTLHEAAMRAKAAIDLPAATGSARPEMQGNQPSSYSQDSSVIPPSGTRTKIGELADLHHSSADEREFDMVKDEDVNNRPSYRPYQAKDEPRASDGYSRKKATGRGYMPKTLPALQPPIVKSEVHELRQPTHNDPSVPTKRTPPRRQTRETSVEIGSRIHSPATRRSEDLGGRDSRDVRCHETPKVIERREQHGRDRFRKPPLSKFSRPWNEYHQGRRQSRPNWRYYGRTGRESREIDRRGERRSRSRDSQVPNADVIREMKRIVRRYDRQSD